MLIGRKRGLELRHCSRGDTAKPRVVAVDRRDLCNDRFQASVVRTEDDGVTACEACPPEADALLVQFWPVLEVGDGAPPVVELLPRIDVLPRFSAAIGKAAMVVQQHDEPRFGERFGECLDAVVLGAAVAVGHGDGRERRSRVFRDEQPRRKLDPAVDREAEIFLVT
jgi:hypothetical protein